jgi:hypothetical protein
MPFRPFYILFRGHLIHVHEHFLSYFDPPYTHFIYPEDYFPIFAPVGEYSLHVPKFHLA